MDANADQQPERSMAHSVPTSDSPPDVDRRLTGDDMDPCPDDLQAITDYMVSDRFRGKGVELGDQRHGRPAVSLDPLAVNRGPASFFSGIVGPTALALTLAVMMPIGMKLVEELVSVAPTYPVMMAIVQTLFLPPVIAYSFAVVTPMFWYGPLWARFAMAMLVGVPACLGFYVSFTLLISDEDPEFWFGFVLVIFSAFLAIAAIAVSAQLWSRFSLSHAREDNDPLPPIGLRAIFELTGIAAIYLAFASQVDFGDYLEGMLLFGGIGLFSSVGIISSMIVYFGAGRLRRVGILVMIGFVFASSMVINGFFAALQYGLEALTYEVLMIAAVSIYGTLLTLAVMWLCLRWLRFCGWTCVNQKTQIGQQA